MAVLTNNSGAGGLRIEEQCPAGTHVAVIGHIEDKFGVERRKYENPAEMETLDVTKFFFGVLVGNQPYRVGTYEMRISGNPKAKLYKFLTDLLGAPPPQGWDYCELEGRGAIIRVEEKVSQAGNAYSIVTGVRAVNDGLTDYSDRVPSADQFDWNLGEDDEGRANGVPQQAAAAGQPTPAPAAAPARPPQSLPAAPTPAPAPAPASQPQPAMPAPQPQAQRPPLPDPASDDIPF